MYSYIYGVFSYFDDIYIPKIFAIHYTFISTSFFLVVTRDAEFLNHPPCWEERDRPQTKVKVDTSHRCHDGDAAETILLELVSNQRFVKMSRIETYADSLHGRFRAS